MLSPPSPDFGEDFLAMLRHILDETARHPCLLVPRPPYEQLQKYGREINPFFG